MFANLVQLESVAPNAPNQAAPAGKPPDQDPSPFAVFLQTLQSPTGALMGQPLPTTAASALPTKSPTKNAPNVSSSAVPTPRRTTQGALQTAAIVVASPSVAKPLPSLPTVEPVSPVAPAIVTFTAVELDPVSSPTIAGPGGAVDSRPTPLPSKPVQSTVLSPAILPALDSAAQVSPSVPSVDDDSTGAASPGAAQNQSGPAGTSWSADAPAQFLDFLPQIQTATQPTLLPVGPPPAASIASPGHAEPAGKQKIAINDPVAAAMPHPTATGAEAQPLIGGEKASPGKMPSPPVTTTTHSFANIPVVYTAPSGSTSEHMPSAVSLADDLFVTPHPENHQPPTALGGDIHPKSNSGASTAESVDTTSSKTTSPDVSDSTNATLNPVSAIAAVTSAPIPSSGFVAAPCSPVEQSILPPTPQAPGNASQPPAATSAKLDAPQPTTIVTGPVQMARLVNGITQSEMHIGLRTQAFGNVELHTVVRDSQLGLAVGSEKGNLRSFLNSEMPTLQASLGQHNIRFDGIRFLENSGGAGTGFSGGAEQQHPRSFNQANSPADPSPTVNDAPEISLEEEIATEGNSKISVLA